MRVMFCTVPEEKAPAIARQLVERRLVACVNIVPGVRSVYRWEGAIQEEGEALLVMKTSDAGVERVLEQLPALHPYAVPEILALTVSAGHAPYVHWVEEETCTG